MHAIAAGLKLAVSIGVLTVLAACAAAPPLAPSSLAAPSLATSRDASISMALMPLSKPDPVEMTAQQGRAEEKLAPLVEQLVNDRQSSVQLSGEPTREYQRGAASWYGPGFHGRRTASGERYDMHAMTAAHRTLPFGTVVRVQSLVNGREVDVRITDRGPFSGSRVIDVSRGAAMALGMLGVGYKEVALRVLDVSVPLPVEKTKATPFRKRRRGIQQAAAAP